MFLVPPVKPPSRRSRSVPSSLLFTVGIPKGYSILNTFICQATSFDGVFRAVAIDCIAFTLSGIMFYVVVNKISIYHNVAADGRSEGCSTSHRPSLIVEPLHADESLIKVGE